jgi:hypothetical protein
MKSSQWIGAVVVLALVVFGITFFRNYTTPQDSGTSPGPKPPVDGPETKVAELDFADKLFPPDTPTGPVPLPYEVHKQGIHDFWFEQTKDPVTVGLNRKTCKCTTVELFVLNEHWKGRRSELEKAGPDDKIWSELQSTAPPTHLEKNEEVAKVPPGATGFVRLTWKGERPGAQNLQAELWQGRPDGPTQKLELRLFFVNPISLDAAEQTTYQVTEQDLPKTVTYHCFSVTRKDFKIQVVPANSRWSTEEDPFTVKTTLLKEDELAALQERVIKEGPIKVQRAYKIDVTIQPHGQDGKTPIEIGVFGRRFEVRSDEEGIEPVRFLVIGELQGSVKVGLADDKGMVTFNGFRGDRGTQKVITLLSDEKGLELKLDTEHTAKFLDVKLENPQSFSNGRQTWKLSVRVPPGRVHGSFPRQDDPVYRDSAVYVKMLDGKQPRSLRIPVSGEATDR